MSWRLEKVSGGSDLVWDGVETGIAPSPTKGTANIQNANISTETGEVLASFARYAQYAPTPSISGTLTASGGAGATLLGSSSSALYAGMWINISSTTITKITESVNYLLVGGGGSGGKAFFSNSLGAGGGGAGQVKPVSGHTISVQAYSIVVGAGGTLQTVAGTHGNDGASSTFDGDSAVGGGGGGGGLNESGRDGASGGGSAGSGTGGIASAGHNGGVGTGTGQAGGGGGGGSGVAGGNGSGTTGGAGGNGTANSITGASVTYAGGGGGGSGTTGIDGSGGTGGGGGGSHTTNDATAGTANTGSGGGGGGYGVGNQGNSGAGGSGVVIISYTTGVLTATGGSITTSGGNTIHTFNSNGTFTVTAILTTIATGNYYVSYRNGSQQVKISTSYDSTGSSALTHGTSGTATFTSIIKNLGSPTAKAVEKYNDGTSTQYRYYILDSNSYVWLYDTGLYARTLVLSGVGTMWFLPDIASYSGYVGIAVLNGWLLVANDFTIYGKSTSNLGAAFVGSGIGFACPLQGNPHYMYSGHQGKMFYTDGNFIGEVFPTISLVSFGPNIQSYSSYTASTVTGTITAIIGGSLPYSSTRIPAIFFTDALGTQPTNLTSGTVYYIEGALGSLVFNVYGAISGGSPIDIAAGAVGNQFFNTFYPVISTGGSALMSTSSQRVNLPFFEISQCMIEIGNTIIIGCAGNTLYPWNQIDATPSDVIELPEANVKTMINVNNMGYVFAGNKGNIYITNNSVASGVLKVPDYCAGIAGTPSTYIEPYFIWGDAMYLRGRVYFSILDQTAIKAGNCGGVWSFVPTQNFYVGQDIGISLRLENQNSYGSYNGYAKVLIPSDNQQAIAPQYWAGWQNSYTVGTSTLFGIDFTNTIPVTTFSFETDLLATGTFLDKDTFNQIEYKLTTPLASGDSVQLYYRVNSTDAFVSCGTVVIETDNQISGYFDPNFQKTQWIQFKAIATTSGTSNSSFVRFKEIRFR